MRRNSHDMQVNVAGIRRNIKNFAHNYSDAQKKVREATSNDPWGPSSTIMAEIADLTYNVVAFSEIMQMVSCIRVEVRNAQLIVKGVEEIERSW